MDKKNRITEMADKYGTPFYLFDSEKFINTFKRITAVFKNVYKNFNIAYSFKTNYTPRVCSIVKTLGGQAEIVSGMEGMLALRTGFGYKEIIFNGPYKDNFAFELLLNGGTVIIDNKEEAEKILAFAESNKGVTLNIGLRLNFNVGKDKISRFGLDVESDDVAEIFEKFTSCDNISLNGFHCHIGGAREIEFWQNRAGQMLKQIRKFNFVPKFIDLGSGMFGEMEYELAKQFTDEVPGFERYAEAALKPFAEEYEKCENKPKIFCEFGTTVIANAMSFAAKVTSVKKARGKSFAVFDCSSHNLGVLSTKKNLPINVIGEGNRVENVNFVGYTCIEDDCFYRNYNGNLAVGNLVVFGNVGSYSVVMKPPFILPNVKIIETDDNLNDIRVIKRDETFEDIFSTYVFD